MNTIEFIKNILNQEKADFKDEENCIIDFYLKNAKNLDSFDFFKDRLKFLQNSDLQLRLAALLDMSNHCQYMINQFEKLGKSIYDDISVPLLNVLSMYSMLPLLLEDSASKNDDFNENTATMLFKVVNEALFRMNLQRFQTNSFEIKEARRQFMIKIYLPIALKNILNNLDSINVEDAEKYGTMLFLDSSNSEIYSKEYGLNISSHDQAKTKLATILNSIEEFEFNHDVSVDKIN